MNARLRATILPAVLAIGTLAAVLVPQPARAWWVGYGFRPPVVVVPPPRPYYYAPPPVVAYAPPPYYVPRRVWIPGHYRGPYWVPPHWG